MNLISFMKNVIFKKTTNMSRLVKVELVNIEEAVYKMSILWSHYEFKYELITL